MTLSEAAETPTALEEKRAANVAEQEKAREAEEQLQQVLDELIPKPVGYSVLVVLPDPEETYAGGLIKAARTVEVEQILSSVGLVIDMGPQAYKGNDVKYSEGPWCKEGDFVMFRPNSGTRFKMGRREYRLLNDDSIEAVVPDPKAISSAM